MALLGSHRLVTEPGGYSESVGAACALCSPVNPMSASCWTRTCRSRYPREFSIESSFRENVRFAIDFFAVDRSVSPVRRSGRRGLAGMCL